MRHSAVILPSFTRCQWYKIAFEGILCRVRQFFPALNFKVTSITYSLILFTWRSFGALQREFGPTSL